MPGVELKSIMIHEDSNAGSANEDVKTEIECSKDMKKIVNYKLFNNKLRKAVEDKLRLNDDMLFCGFVVESEYDVLFKNQHFSYTHELSNLKNSFMECGSRYLGHVVNNRFWFTYLLNLEHNCDVMKVYAPSDKGFTVPKVRAVFVRYESWVTGCIFKKTHYRIVDNAVDEE